MNGEKCSINWHDKNYILEEAETLFLNEDQRAINNMTENTPAMNQIEISLHRQHSAVIKNSPSTVVEKFLYKMKTITIAEYNERISKIGSEPRVSKVGDSPNNINQWKELKCANKFRFTELFNSSQKFQWKQKNM